MRRGFVVVLVILLLGAASVARAEAPCSINTVRGTYAFEVKGQYFQGEPSSVPGPGGMPMLQGTVLPFYFSGTFAIALDGSFAGGYAGLFGLVPLGAEEPVPWAGTVSVDPDCTGELVWPDAFGGTTRERIVVLDNGREIRTVPVEAMAPWHTTAVQLSRANGPGPLCGPQTARGRYVMRCEGIEVESPLPPPTYAGVSPLFLFEVAADGTMIGRHFGRGLPSDGYETSGMVTVNPDCTTQILMQTDAVPGATILVKGVFYDNGKEMYGGPLFPLIGGQPAIGAFFGFGCHTTRLTR